MEKIGSTSSSVVEEEEHLHEGSKVEVFFCEEDCLQNAWLSAVVLKTPLPYCSPSSSSEMKKRKTSSDSKVLVRYDHLQAVVRNYHRKPPITQYVEPFFIRPLPPPEDSDQQVIELNDIVDAFHHNVWWTGVVITVVGDKYYVEFKNPPDILELVRSQIRLHWNWVQGTWIRPQKHQKTARSSLFNPGEAIEVNLENELPCIVWLPAIFLGEVGPNQFLVQSKNSKIEGEGFHKISVKLHQIRPHPPRAEVKFDVFEKVDAFDGLCWWVGVITKVLTGRRYYVNFMRGKKMKEFSQSELRPHLEWVNGRWDTKSLNVTYSPDYKPHYLHACNSTKNSTVATRNESSGAKMENTEEEASCSTNKRYGQKEQNDVGMSNEILKKGEDKLPIVIALAAAVGKQKNGAGVVAVDCTTDKVKLPMTARVEVFGDQLNRAADVGNCRTDKSELTVEVTGSEDALRDGTALVSATDCLAEEVMVAVDGISSNSVSDNQPLSMSINEIHSIENANDSGSTDDIEENNGLCLPFVKTFPIWQQFESMEAFRKFPQNPHFQPLIKSKEIYREGFAIGNMFAFVSLVEMITKFEIDAPGELFIEATETLVEMERMGFNVKALQGRLNELQLIQVKLRQLEDDSKGVKTKITNSIHKRTKVNKEFYELCLEMKKLEEKKARLITETVATSTELDMWQSENADILEDIQRMKQNFLALRRV